MFIYIFSQSNEFMRKGQYRIGSHVAALRYTSLWRCNSENYDFNRTLITNIDF